MTESDKAINRSGKIDMQWVVVECHVVTVTEGVQRVVRERDHISEQVVISV